MDGNGAHARLKTAQPEVVKASGLFSLRPVPLPPPKKVDEGLYLSTIDAASQPEMLKERSITHVISLGRKVPNDKRLKEIEDKYFYMDMNDDESENWEAVTDRNAKGKHLIEFIEKENLANPKNRVLIHCSWGICRSVFVTLFILIAYRGYTVLEALRKVQACNIYGELFKTGKSALLKLKPPSPSDVEAIDAMLVPHRFMELPKEYSYEKHLLQFKGYTNTN